MSAHAHVLLCRVVSFLIFAFVVWVSVRDLRKQRFWKWWTSDGGIMWLLAWMIIYTLLA